MKRRALMGVVFFVALAVLVLWRPLESGRSGEAGTAGEAALGLSERPLPISKEHDGRLASAGVSEAPSGGAARAWWEGSGANGDDASAPLPMRKVVTPSGGVRFVSAVVALDPALDGAGDDEGRGSDDSALGEPSDLDDDHPGAYWSNLGYTSIRGVLADLGVAASRAWVDSASGDILVAQSGAKEGSGEERLIALSPEPTPGDADGDGSASGLDVARFLRLYARKSIEADVNDDGVVDPRDLTKFLSDWGSAAR